MEEYGWTEKEEDGLRGCGISIALRRERGGRHNTGREKLFLVALNYISVTVYCEVITSYSLPKFDGVKY